MSLAADNLSFGYGAHIIGASVSLSVAPGEAVALLGPNGGGKTTLLKTMLGLLPPIAGKLMIDDTPLAALSPGERARAIGYVPQVHAGIFAFSVREIVLMGRTAHQGLFASPSDRDRAIANEAIAALGLEALAEKPYTMISGGERQLALVARALAQEPRYVVLDEPTASLDFGNQGRVMRQIRSLAARGLGVLFTTHDPNQALRYADRVALLRDGAMLAQGPADALLAAPVLRELYGADVEELNEPPRRAFLPG